jgi:hypothetical protein
METGNREAKTIINHLPLNDSVIIKRVTEHSVIELNGSPTEDVLLKRETTNFKYLEVVAYGNQTHTIEIGDKVFIDFTTSLQEVKVNDNPKSFSKLRDIVKDKDVIKNVDKVEMWGYYRISFYAIYSKEVIPTKIYDPNNATITNATIDSSINLV